MRGLEKRAPDGAPRQTHTQTDMATRPSGAELVKIVRVSSEAPPILLTYLNGNMCHVMHFFFRGGGGGGGGGGEFSPR